VSVKMIIMIVFKHVSLILR